MGAKIKSSTTKSTVKRTIRRGKKGQFVAGGKSGKKA